MLVIVPGLMNVMLAEYKESPVIVNTRTLFNKYRANRVLIKESSFCLLNISMRIEFCSCLTYSATIERKTKKRWLFVLITEVLLQM